MSKKRTKYTSAFKTKLVLELLQKGYDNLSMFKNLLKYRHESKKTSM
ncbi:hypothetical protein BSPLISOX_1648 [uncultured Gammaproteobacteria bacterium]|nr:hypothetical protein [uncultured Gammaproteobacteria bacterium]CAC9451082.1 hypothetical protein [uncultured Gammaproteobacteria bacterium]VVH67196.1 hypothetical protein BSPLISOX_1648 [uncultured Gammaproteobacteria bacterium]